MGDLTTFSCIARTEQSILLPADIIVKFDDAAADALIYLGQETTTFFGGYPAEVQYKDSKNQRLIMQKYEEPADYFISHILLNNMLIEKILNHGHTAATSRLFYDGSKNVNKLFANIGFLRTLFVLLSFN